MCIIIYKPSKIKLPSESILKSAWNNNPDGAGFMFRNIEGKIVIQKGFMKFNHFYNVLKSLKEDITETDLVIHFRFATQGTISAENTHPFPITDSIKGLKQLNVITNSAIVHNGIVNFCNLSKQNNKLDLSDTQLFIMNYLAKISIESLNNESIHELILHATSSKFILMTKEQTNIIGNFIEDKGIYYSNSTYKEYKKEKYTYQYSKKDNNKTKKDIEYIPSYCESCLEQIDSAYDLYKYYGVYVCKDCYDVYTEEDRQLKEV